LFVDFVANSNGTVKNEEHFFYFLQFAKNKIILFKSSWFKALKEPD